MFIFRDDKYLEEGSNNVEDITSTLQAIKLHGVCNIGHYNKTQISRKRSLEICLTKVDDHTVKRYKSIVHDKSLIPKKLAPGTLVWGFCNGWFPGR